MRAIRSKLPKKAHILEKARCQIENEEETRTGYVPACLNADEANQGQGRAAQKLLQLRKQSLVVGDLLVDDLRARGGALDTDLAVADGSGRHSEAGQSWGLLAIPRWGRRGACHHDPVAPIAPSATKAMPVLIARSAVQNETSPKV